MDIKIVICIVVLSLIVLALLIKLFTLKSNLRSLTRELKNTRQDSYNRQTRVTLSDRDVEGLAAEINRNIDYQKSLKLETEQSRRQLEQSISDIAHDLRTPLTVVKGNLQMLEKEELSEKGRTYLEVSSKKTETLKGMVDEFFELSVLESDSKPVELQKLDAIVFLSEFIIEHETLIRQKDLKPEITFPEKSIYVQANKAMLSRVFSNLFGNILKYADESFNLSLEEEEGVCLIRIGNKVADPASIDIEHRFDRTYRADKARSDGSAGLGLYIAKLLLEKQKGGIDCEIVDNRLVFTVCLRHYE